MVLGCVKTNASYRPAKNKSLLIKTNIYDTLLSLFLDDKAIWVIWAVIKTLLDSTRIIIIQQAELGGIFSNQNS